MAQSPAPATLGTTHCKLKKSELRVLLLQLRKDVIDLRSRAKVVQENSVHLWSEIFLRYWIILGNKTRVSEWSFSSPVFLPSCFCLSLFLPSLPPSFLPLFFLPGRQGKHSKSIYEANCRVHLDSGFGISSLIFCCFSLEWSFRGFPLQRDVKKNFWVHLLKLDLVKTGCFCCLFFFNLSLVFYGDKIHIKFTTLAIFKGTEWRTQSHLFMSYLADCEWIYNFLKVKNPETDIFRMNT